MASPQLLLLRLLRQGGPALARNLPKLWPLLLESGNRRRLAEAARDLASRSPGRRLAARAEMTAALADSIAEDATTPADVAAAQDWSRRSRNLRRRLEMPVAGRAQKAAHRASVREQLEALQAEMDEHLGG